MENQPARMMTSTSAADYFWEGARAGVPVMIAVAPFGLLFGALAVDNGFTIFDTVFMSALLFAGASQMVGLDLYGQDIAPWVIVLSIFAVNFRHILYSATTGRHIAHFTFWQKALSFFVLTDVQFAETENRANAKEPIPFIWYFGLALPLYLSWVLEAYIGAAFGNLITNPHAIGIDFMLPIYFLGLVMSFRSRVNWLPVVLGSAVTSIAAYHYIGSPWHVSGGAIGGIIVAVIMAKKPDFQEPEVRSDV